MNRLNKSITVFFILSVAWCMFSGTCQAATKATTVKQGNAYYQQGQYKQALEQFQKAYEKDPESDIINFDVGTALYKNGEFQKSIEHTQKVLLSEEKTLKQKAHYNLGNAFYKNGIQREDRDINAAIASLKNALPQYEQAMRIDPKDEDAKNNFEFVKKELDRLQEKKQKQEKEKSQQCKNPQESDSSKQESSKDKQKEQQGQKTQQNQSQESGEQQQEQQRKEDQGTEDQKQKKEGQKKEDQRQEEQKKEEKKQGTQEQTQTGAQGEQEEKKKENQQVKSQLINPQDLSKEEAERMIQRYEQREEPKGLLNFYKQDLNQQRTLKDW